MLQYCNVTFLRGGRLLMEIRVPLSLTLPLLLSAIQGKIMSRNGHSGLDKRILIIKRKSIARFSSPIFTLRLNKHPCLWGILYVYCIWLKFGTKSANCKCVNGHTICCGIGHLFTELLCPSFSWQDGIEWQKQAVGWKVLYTVGPFFTEAYIFKLKPSICIKENIWTHVSPY